MNKEEIELLLQLLKKANEEDVLRFYDAEEHNYIADWIFIDNNKIYIKID